MGRLAEQIKRARQVEVSVGERWKFTARRPTKMELAEWRELDGIALIRKIFSECVVGWSGVTEADLFAGGGDLQPDFERDAFLAWADDNIDVAVAIRDAVMKAVTDWQEQVEASAKN